MINELSGILRKGRETAKHSGVQIAVTTNMPQITEDGVTYDTPRDIERTNHIWVLIDGDLSKPVSVWNIGAARVPYKENIQVVLNTDVFGNLKIIDSDPTQVDFMYGEAANTLFLGELVGEIISLVLPSRKFKPLRVRPDASGGLNVVIENGIYQFSDHSYAYMDVTPIDLSTITVSSGMKRPVLVGIDPATNTPTTAYGDEVPITLPEFTIVEYNAVIEANLSKLWLAGYQRKDGITAFQTAQDLTDARAWLSPGAGGVAAGNTFMPINLDFELIIPVNRQVPVKRLNIIDGGILQLNGILDLI